MWAGAQPSSAACLLSPSSSCTATLSSSHNPLVMLTLSLADAVSAVSQHQRQGSSLAGEHDRDHKWKGEREEGDTCSFSPQVSRALAACSHSFCWTEASLLQSWDCGTVWVLWPAPLQDRPWAGPCWPGTGEPSSACPTHPLICPPSLTCSISPPQEAAAPAEVTASVSSWGPGLPDHPALLLGHPGGQAGSWHSPER